jgi:hypothetical protein
MCTVKNLIILGEETNFAIVLIFVSLETVIYIQTENLLLQNFTVRKLT